MAGRIRVLIVDDSAVVRAILTERLGAVEDIVVAGAAMDPFVARELIATTRVDVLLLDIEMPRMDGLTFLKYLMKYRPIPAIILSSLADGSNEASVRALELGAIAIVPKPGGPLSVTQLIDDLADQIRAAAAADMERVQRDAASHFAKYRGVKKLLGSIRTTEKLIAIGASTGGTIALERLFGAFPADCPPTVTVIHMPERFTATYAKRLDDLCSPRIKEAEDQEPALSGYVYIAPGNRHLTVDRAGARYVLRVLDGPRVHNQRPAVDVLFRGVADNVGRNAVGALLTGMGRDGAEALLRMRQKGAFTVAQDEATSVVYGMPKEAVALGAACVELPLDRIAAELIQRARS